MDMNEFAKTVTELEGKKVQVNIAQVKEILKIICKLLARKGLNLKLFIRTL